MDLQPVDEESSFVDLRKLINAIVEHSGFGTQDAGAASNDELQRRAGDRRFKRDGPTLKQIRGPGKGLDCWPVFAMGIRGREAEVSVEHIARVLAKLMYEWLQSQHLSPRRPMLLRTKHAAGTDESPTGASFGRSDRLPLNDRSPVFRKLRSAGSSWNMLSHICILKPSDPEVTQTEATSSAVLPTHQESPRDPTEVIELDQQLPKKPGDATEAIELDQDRVHIPHPGEKQALVWHDPCTGEEMELDARSGMSWAKSSREAALSVGRTGPSSTLRVTGAANGVTRSKGEKSVWLDALLAKGENPVFAAAETSIPHVSNQSNLEYQPRTHAGAQRSLLKQHGLPDGRRQHLQQAQVIGRVDRKFILVKVPSGGGSEDEAVLGLIDQHAADERIHVETLFRELCRRPDGGPTAVPFTSKLGHEAGTAVVILDQATVVEVVEYESRSLRERAAHLARWGLMFDMDRSESGGEEWPEGSGRGQVTVRALPAGVAARCYVEPEGIVKMLRAEAGAGSAPEARATPHAAPGETQTWQQEMPDCPPGIIEMLQGRECVDLVQRLGPCAQPVQCAHGRRSLAVLVRVGALETRLRGGRAHADDVGFVAAYHRCRARSVGTTPIRGQ